MYLATFYLATFLSGVIAVISLLRWKERDTATKLLTAMFGISAVCNASQYLALIYHIPVNVNSISTLYDFSSIALMIPFYYIITGRKYLTVFAIITVAISGWSLFVVLFIQTVGQVTSYMKLGISFMQAFFSILYFYRLMKDLPAVHLHRLPVFWFNAAFLLFASGTIFLFASLEFIVQASEIVTGFWVFHNSQFILCQLMVLMGLYFDERRIRAKHGLA